MTDKPRMIAIDMDGTLVHPDGRVTLANQTALERARQAGARIVIATGRRHSYAMKVLRSTSLHRDDTVLSSNGTVARTIGGALLFRCPMPLDLARRLCGQLGEFRKSLVLTFDLHTDGEERAGALVLEDLEDLYGSIRNWVEANARSIRRVEPIEAALDDPAAGPPIQAMLCGSVASMRQAETMLAAAHFGELELFRTEYPQRDLCILDILPRGCSKGSGLLHLLEKEGLSQQELMSLGDNWNDLPMLELAHWPVLMGNAPDALQALARERGWPVTVPHHQDAVAAALNVWF